MLSQPCNTLQLSVRVQPFILVRDSSLSFFSAAVHRIPDRPSVVSIATMLVNRIPSSVWIRERWSAMEHLTAVTYFILVTVFVFFNHLKILLLFFIIKIIVCIRFFSVLLLQRDRETMRGSSEVCIRFFSVLFLQRDREAMRRSSEVCIRIFSVLLLQRDRESMRGSSESVRWVLAPVDGLVNDARSSSLVLLRLDPPLDVLQQVFSVEVLCEGSSHVANVVRVRVHWFLQTGAEWSRCVAEGVHAVVDCLLQLENEKTFWKWKVEK